MNKDELHRRIAAWLDGRITADDSEALQETLRTSPEARDEFRRWTHLDAALREQGRPRRGKDRSVAGPRRALPRRSAGWRPPPRSPPCSASPRSGCTTAGTSPHRKSPAVRRSRRTRAAPSSRGRRMRSLPTPAGLRVGDTIRPGALRLTRGAAQIEFFSGASMILQAGASLELVSPWEAICRAGKVTVRVPPPAQGFRLRTAGLDLVDLGTEFGVEARAGGATEVHVFEGKVEAHPENAAMQLLSTGQSLRRASDRTLSPGQARAGGLSQHRGPERGQRQPCPGPLRRLVAARPADRLRSAPARQLSFQT